MRNYQGADYQQVSAALAWSDVVALANVHEALRKLGAQVAHRREP